MSEWVERSLGEICLTIRAGGTPVADNPSYYGGDIPFVTIEDITRAGRTIEHTARSLTKAGVDASAAWIVPENHLLYSMYATLGKVTRNVLPMSTNQAILAIKPDTRLIETDTLFYLLQMAEQSVASLASQTTQANLNAEKVRKFKVLFPASLRVQRRITEILSTLDDTIEQTEALIAKMQQVKAGLMHDLFTRGVTPDGRLRPTREHAPDLYKESPIGWIPKDWEVEKLGNILRRCGGYLQTGPFGSQLHAYEYQLEGVPVVMPQDINDGLVCTEQIARIHEARADQLARHRMRIGDIVIARRGDLSRAAAITEEEQGWVCGTGCFLLRLGQSAMNAKYAAYAYSQDFAQRQIAGRAVGTTMPSLNNSIMASLFFPFCDQEEQARIVDRLEGVEQNICALSKCLYTNQQLKHGLMHDLLTGQMLVPIPRAELSAMG